MEDRAKEYSKVKLKLAAFNMVYTVVLLAALIAFGWSVAFREYAFSLSGNATLQVVLYFFCFSLFFFCFTLPVDLYTSFFLEHRYGLSNESFLGWAKESVKKQVLSFVLSALLVVGLYALIGSQGDAWWLSAWCAWIFITVIMARLWPIFILPLFYKTSPLEDKGLSERLQSFLKSCGIDFKNIYSLNLSKTTKKVNAAFCGLGKTKRILLSDTLLCEFDADEIEAVLAHEVGHFKRKHILKNVAVSSAVSFAMFWIAQGIFSTGVNHYGYEGIGDLAAFPLLSLIAYMLGLILLPAQNLLSRRMENEADDFAFQTVEKKESFFSTMNKLAEINLADKTPHPVIEFLLYSHPSIQNRIDRQLAKTT